MAVGNEPALEMDLVALAGLEDSVGDERVGRVSAGLELARLEDEAEAGDDFPDPLA